MQKYKGSFLVILSAVIFGCTPLITFSIYAEGVNTPTLVMLRAFFALPFLSVMMKRKKISFKLKKGEFIKIAVVSLLGSALTPYMLMIAYKYISTGMATTLHFVYPTLVIVGCVLFFRSPADKRQWMAALFCCAGASMFCSFDGKVNVTGVILAITSGAVYAAYIIALEKSGVERIDSVKYCFYGAISCAAFMAMVCGLSGAVQLPKTAKGWILCVLFSVSMLVIGEQLFKIGVGITGSKNAAVLSTFEPITGNIIGIAVFGESFGIRNAFGTVLILISVILLACSEQPTAQTEQQHLSKRSQYVKG